MSFLVWGPPPGGDIRVPFILPSATDSLEAVNDIYGCPYLDANGYRMDTWDVVRVSRDGYAFGFTKPEPRLGKDLADLMDVMLPGFTEYEEIPEEFIPEEEAV